METEFNLMKKIDKLFKEYKTSWKYLQNHGLKDSEEYGDCIFLNMKIGGVVSPAFDLLIKDIVKEFIKRLKEELRIADGSLKDEMMFWDEVIDKLAGTALTGKPVDLSGRR